MDVEMPMKDTLGDIERAVKNRFAALALRPTEEQRFPVEPERAKRLGYAVYEIEALPRAVTAVA
jgi:hypothetical protein